MIRQCKENKSGCLPAVVRTAAVRTRDNREMSSLGECGNYGMESRHPRLGRSTEDRWYVSRAYCAVARSVMELPRWCRDGPLIRTVLGC